MLYTTKYKALTIYLKRGDKRILVKRRSEQGVKILKGEFDSFGFFIVMVNVVFMYGAVSSCWLKGNGNERKVRIVEHIKHVY
ncbi:hypothetical protein COI42_12620 [Priestia aryabhattai]|nr:hypothetical protein COI42_12620 [Priestia aryabhattai]